MLHLTEREAILHAHQIMSSPVASAQLTLDIVSVWEETREVRAVAHRNKLFILS